MMDLFTRKSLHDIFFVTMIFIAMFPMHNDWLIHDFENFVLMDRSMGRNNFSKRRY
jgi:hypothetical protein